MRAKRHGMLAAGFVAVSFTFLCAAAAAGEGTVVSLRGGTLERHESGAWRDIAEGRKVSTGDRLRTGKGAVAVIEMSEVGRLVVGPAAEVELGREPKDFTTKLSRGALWLKTAAPAGSRAAISTPIATAGVRSTAFSMVYGEGETSVCACTCTGSIEVTTPDGRKLAVRKGEYVAIPAGEPVPVATQPAAPVLSQSGTVWDFCQACHVAGGKGELKPGWR